MNVACGVPIVDEPSIYVPQSGNKVADCEDYNYQTQHAEGVAHDYLPHDVIVVLLWISGSFAFFLQLLELSLQLWLVIVLDDIVELPGVKELEDLLQAEELKEMQQLEVLIWVLHIELVVEEEPEGDHWEKIEYEIVPVLFELNIISLLEVSDRNLLKVSNRVKEVFAPELSKEIYRTNTNMHQLIFGNLLMIISIANIISTAIDKRLTN